LFSFKFVEKSYYNLSIIILLVSYPTIAAQSLTLIEGYFLGQAICLLLYWGNFYHYLILNIRPNHLITQVHILKRIIFVIHHLKHHFQTSFISLKTVTQISPSRIISWVTWLSLFIPEHLLPVETQFKIFIDKDIQIN